MTDQTVSVPVELLRTLDASIRGTTWETVQFDAPPLGAAVQALTDLIPTPPKVGDILTKEQIEALPGRSVIRDREDDIWVTDGKGTVSLIYFYGTTGRPGNAGGNAAELADYQPVLVSLPSE